MECSRLKEIKQILQLNAAYGPELDLVLGEKNFKEYYWGSNLNIDCGLDKQQ